MNSNSDGLSPSLRPQLGVGWNRALPASFGFDKSFKGDGINDHFMVPRISGISIPNAFTLEFWCKPQANLSSFIGYFAIVATDSKVYMVQSGGTNIFQFIPPTGGQTASAVVNVGTWNHAVLIVDFTALTTKWVINGNIASPAIGTLTTAFSGTISALYVNSRFPLSTGNIPLDEYRLYPRVLNNDEILLNYNSGIGNNPCKTEGLLLWYKFEEFENLDFSVLQDNSDMKVGIRDLSGHNYHAQPFNMDVDSASPSYVLKNY